MAYKISDLEDMRLKVTDYSQQPDLADAIRRYYTLLQMSFSSNIYKIFETPETQIYRFASPPSSTRQAPTGGDVAIIELACKKCQSDLRIQANLGGEQPLQQGCIPYPASNKLPCPNCGTEIDLTDARRQVEAQSKKPVFVPEEKS